MLWNIYENVLKTQSAKILLIFLLKALLLIDNVQSHPSDFEDKNRQTKFLSKDASLLQLLDLQGYLKTVKSTFPVKDFKYILGKFPILDYLTPASVAYT